MNKLILTALAVVALSGMLMAPKMNAQSKNSDFSFAVIISKMAVLTWEKSSMELGKIPQNIPVTLTYNFTNTGTAPLVITNVQPGCGCTTADFTKESIAPGKKGFVKLIYNAKSEGVFSKSATVTTNAEPAMMTIVFNGEVVADSKVKTN